MYVTLAMAQAVPPRPAPAPPPPRGRRRPSTRAELACMTKAQLQDAAHQGDASAAWLLEVLESCRQRPTHGPWWQRPVAREGVFMN
jgi:hypothetical protein